MFHITHYYIYNIVYKVQYYFTYILVFKQCISHLNVKSVGICVVNGFIGFISNFEDTVDKKIYALYVFYIIGNESQCIFKTKVY